MHSNFISVQCIEYFQSNDKWAELKSPFIYEKKRDTSTNMIQAISTTDAVGCSCRFICAIFSIDLNQINFEFNEYHSGRGSYLWNYFQNACFRYHRVFNFNRKNWFSFRYFIIIYLNNDMLMHTLKYMYSTRTYWSKSVSKYVRKYYIQYWFFDAVNIYIISLFGIMWHILSSPRSNDTKNWFWIVEMTLKNSLTKKENEFYHHFKCLQPI